MTDCYHCGLPVPDGVDFRLDIAGVAQPMCCLGCHAVASAIVAGGLGDYYRHRDALPASQRQALPDIVKNLSPDSLDFSAFDHPDIQKSFVRSAADDIHLQEAALMLEGITCAACVWLNETYLRRQPGVVSIDINYTTRRARIRWDKRITRLSALLEAVAAIGYRAHPYDAKNYEELAQKERKASLWRLFVAGFGMMQVMMYAVPVYMAQTGSGGEMGGEMGGDMSADIERLMRWASLILTLPVVLYSAAPFFAASWRDLKLRRIGMDLPVALGVGAAFSASVLATLSSQGEVYFDSVSMFVFFLLGGRHLELMARQRAVRGVETLARAMPAIATRLPAWPERSSERVAVAELKVGDYVEIAPGETAPADGVVAMGASAAEESLLTGESRPVGKTVGDKLIGGSINIQSPLIMRVEQVGDATRLAAIQRLMERAALEKPALVLLADRIAARFLVALLLLAAASAMLWWYLDPSQMLGIVVAVLVVSCPCALSLATPAALTVATGALAARGVLVTRGHAIETLARANRFVFDKTGTLTLGKLTLDEVLCLRGARAEALKLAAALEQGSNHPIAHALRRACADAAGGAQADPHVDHLLAITGSGVTGRIDGALWRLGRPAYVGELHGETLPDAVRAKVGAGETVVALASEAGWQAFFCFTDRLRPEAPALIRRLQAYGMSCSLLSGDAPQAVQHIGRQLGIIDAAGGLSPEDKQAALKALQHGDAIVAMVGDGVNDAPVLAQAQVSIALGHGADLARNNADIVLLGDDLAALGQGIDIARRSLRIVRQNLIWAFAYNFLAIPLAIAGWITPWMAGIGMSASSLLVVLNALRLQSSKESPMRESDDLSRLFLLDRSAAIGVSSPAPPRHENPATKYD
ncbi:MAG TPA: heavy metal translocating P-type ATPase [Rhodocyclaceae bacterium]|nr:heavy metal translocating P-type ATPase [Rhodocyclaceae bacterium]